MLNWVKGGSISAENFTNYIFNYYGSFCGFSSLYKGFSISSIYDFVFRLNNARFRATRIQKK